MGRNAGREYGVVLVVVLQWLLLEGVNGDFNYKEALSKSLIFLEAQRSGKLPSNNRVKWRGDSALEDGKLENVDLVGGYYDAGDNVKYGLPLAFTVTTLAWATESYKNELQAAGEYSNSVSAVRWGTDYLLKATSKNALYVQVGDPNLDHQCWTRPENMKQPRTLLKLDSKTPGTEIAAETSAALAASSVVFAKNNPKYASTLLSKAQMLFNFAKSNKGTYDGECPFYCSYSGYNDELLWAATWLYIATKNPMYMKYIKEEALSASVAEFSWDLKFAGAQMLLSKYYWKGEEDLMSFKQEAEAYMCSVMPGSPYQQVRFSPGGLVHFRDGANSQYVTGTAFLFMVYSDILAEHNQYLACGGTHFSPKDLMNFAKQQMDYLLGKNPKGISYMVGFGKNPPKQAHHRGASVPVLPPGTNVNCAMSFVDYYNKDAPNPNELTGAIVGGPDRYDQFIDKRTQSAMTEPTTYTNSLAVGILAKLAAKH